MEWSTTGSTSQIVLGAAWFINSVWQKRRQCSLRDSILLRRWRWKRARNTVMHLQFFASNSDKGPIQCPRAFRLFLWQTLLHVQNKGRMYLPPHNKAEPTFYQLLYEPGQSKLFFLHLVYHVIILGMFALIFGKRETLTSMYT